MSYYFVYPLAYCIGLLPYKVQFLVADMVRFLLFRVVRYRRQVVRENLTNSFPEKSLPEIQAIERKFYAHLADVFIETMSLAAVSRRRIMQRMRYLNADQLEPWIGERSWICAMAHYGSWEYTVNYGLYLFGDAVLAVYRRLHDQGMERYYKKVRERFGVNSVRMEEIGREMVRRLKQQSHVSVALIADQTPPFHEIQNWTMFLGRWTPFFTGMEKMALRLGMPVVFLGQEKVGRGRYEGRFELIYDGVEPVAEGEITARYARRLEEMIRQRPELWMWSHRRWKFTREQWEERHPNKAGRKEREEIEP